MNTDPISDLLTRIRNAQKAHHQSVNIPHSKIKENILKIMKQYKFINNFSTEKEDQFLSLKVQLNEERESLTLKRISKPGQIIYIKSKDLKIVKSGLGLSILSTPKGVMSNVQARKENLGGELLCQIS